MNTLKPVGKLILVKIIKEQEFAGIILPDKAQDNSEFSRFVVQDIGEEVTKVKVGDEIVFLPQALNLKMANMINDLYVIKEEHLLGIVIPIEEKVITPV